MKLGPQCRTESETMQALFLLSTSLFACLSCTDAFVQRSSSSSSLSPGLLISQREPTRSSSHIYLFDFLKPKEDDQSEEEAAAEDPAEDFSDDPIDKIFGFFFGEKEESPMGMKRFGRERFPEQYPAVLDEWAAPVDGDDKDMAALRPLLKKTNLECRNLKVGGAWSGCSHCFLGCF